MVPFALERRFFGLLLVVFAVIAAFSAWTFVRDGDAKCSSRFGHDDSLDKDGHAIAERCIIPASDELESYLRVMQEVANAYSNRQIEAMFKSVKQLPSKAYQLRENDHLKLEMPINQIWRDDWVVNKGVKEFASEEEFDCQMKRSLSIAKLYGEFLLTSGRIADEILVTIDWIALKRLQTYRDEFKRAGRADYLRFAECLLTVWIEQIESEKGFTRSYMRSQKAKLKYFLKTGELTEEKLVAYVRDYVRPLQERCGYTPKWLDAEFPLLPKVCR